MAKHIRKNFGILLGMLLLICCTVFMNVHTVKADFTKGKSVTIKFTAWKNSSNVAVSFYTPKGTSVYSVKIKQVKKGKTYSVKWNGKKSDGKYVSYGDYRARIKIGSESKYTDFFFFGNTSFTGKGTKSDPYKVTNIGQLRKVAKYNGKYFKQMNAIDGHGTALYPLFSNSNSPFTGHYDGNGQRIKNVKLKSQNDILGIFGIVGEQGVVKNLILSSITGSVSSKADCDCGIIAGENYGKLDKIKVEYSSLNEGENIGIIAGINYSNGTISNCESRYNTITATRRGIDIGAVAGETKGKVSTSYSYTCKIDYKYGTEGGAHTTGLGGICGYINGWDAYITKCTTDSFTIKLKNSNGNCYIGAICGDYSSSGILDHVVKCSRRSTYTSYGMIGTKK